MRKHRSNKISKKEQRILEQVLYEELFTVNLVFSYDNDENKEKHAQFFIVLENFPPSIENFNIELMRQIKRLSKIIKFSFDEELVILVRFKSADERHEIRDSRNGDDSSKWKWLYRLILLDIPDKDDPSDYERWDRVQTFNEGYGKLKDIYNSVYTLLFYYLRNKKHT